ncbi:MAG: ABC transporter ATP-binding protein [Brevinematales bacterium]|nr:ABC transporter ATP-binding protein [Brevinematales bacterium]
METVVVQNLTKTFHTFVAVNKISFTVKKGEIFGFLGPNGAGKTTTIKMLCGILTPTEGKGSILGFDIVKEQEPIKQNIGYMSQRFSLYDDLSLEENLAFFGGLYGVTSPLLSARIKKLLEEMEIPVSPATPTRNLPTGIKQRLALAAALIHDPQILFLDEPTSGVDPLMRKKFWEIIYTLAHQGKTIFVTTHYMEEAEYCHRIGLIMGGRLIADNSPQRLKETFEHGVYVLEDNHLLELFHSLASLPWVLHRALFGNTIHIVVPPTIDLATLQQHLSLLGYPSVSIEKTLPSLEHIFLTRVKTLQTI